MENINNNNVQSQSSRLINLMTSTDTVAKDEFGKIISSSDDLLKLVKMITSDVDLFVRILSTEQGTYRVRSIFGISEEINSILLYAIMNKFTEILSHKKSFILGFRILQVCNTNQIKIFYHVMLRRFDAAGMLVLSRSEHGCILLKTAMRVADDYFKDKFLNLIGEHAFLLTRDNLGKSLIKHVLKLDFTQKTTQDDTRLHRVMDKFDEMIFSNSSDMTKLRILALRITSNSKFFMDFVKTRRGSLMVQLFLGKSDRADELFLKAIKQNLTDVITRSRFGHPLVLRLIEVYNERGNFEVERSIQEEIAWKALYLTKECEYGSVMVARTIADGNESLTTIIASRLHRHYVELSFDEYGSLVVRMLVVKGECLLALGKLVLEMLECDEDTLVRMANDEHGNKVFKSALEVARKLRWANLLPDLVAKLKPFLGRLRGSQGENIAAIVDSIVSEGQ